MKLPDLLATKNGRLAAFFFLYLTEGIPLGFTATAIATQMRRQGVGPAEIGVFVSTLYIPWSLKFLIGPVVDVLASDRWGRRRMWIVIAQVLMVTGLLAAFPVDFSRELKFFTLLILIHNVFAATQDVAIDALAVNVLQENERGLANGVMFGAAFLGQAIGGSGVLFLTPVLGFKPTFFVVAACILSVTLLVSMRLREPRGRARPAATGSKLRAIWRQIWSFVVDSARAFFGSRRALVAVLVAVLPAGAYALGLALQSNLAVEMGLDDTQIGWLTLGSTIISAACCVAGGWISDRFGRIRMLALYLFLTAIPTLTLAWAMHQFGWIMPISPTLANRPIPPAALVATFWAMTLLYAIPQGLMYGTRTALFMDVTTPRVAATQFTAYMALLNVSIVYTAVWQGKALERWGYPVTLSIDALVGLVAIALLPLMRRKRHAESPLPPGLAVPETVQP